MQRARSLVGYGSQPICHISDSSHVHYVVPQEEFMTVGPGNECCPCDNDLDRDNGGTKDRVILIEQHGSKKIEIGTLQITNGGHLPRTVLRRYPSSLDLVANSVGADGIHIGIRVPGLRPAESSTEEKLRQIASRIIGTASNTSNTELVRNTCV